MKKLLTIVTLILLAQGVYAMEYTNAPVYESGHYYVFTNATVATNALNAINATGWFPITGINAATGQPEPNKAKTTKWADEVQETADGKFVIPRIPTSLLNKLNVPEAERKAWWDAFLPDVEMYDPNWFPPPEEP